jgi:hypothetical protein
LINILAWIGTFGSITSNFLAAKKNKLAPRIWTFATALLLIVAFIKKDWSNVFLFSVYEALNIFMWIEWSKKSNEKV